MDPKLQRITAAKETLDIFQRGDYGEKHEHSLKSTTLYTPEDLEDLNIESEEKNKPIYELVDLPVVTALKKSHEEGNKNIGILNFASAKNPGGGFLTGALAQEESLAMCSNLYLTQVKNRKYYDENRNCKSMLYTDHMIYSKDVIFIRENTKELWKEEIIADVLTAPAVNMGQYLRRPDADEEHGYEVMKSRMRKVLKVFIKEKNETIILGAYGCGVFRNDPEIIANFFFELLKDEKLEIHFKKIVFAVFDSSKTKNVYNAFEKIYRRFENG